MSLDHENFQMLFEEVVDVCKQHAILLGKPEFKIQLIALIKENRVDACLDTKDAHGFIPAKFDSRKLAEFWFRNRKP